MQHGGRVDVMACGSDFIIVSNGQGNVYAKGANKFGQLGLGTQQAQTRFKCIDFFLDQNVQSIFAG